MRFRIISTKACPQSVNWTQQWTTETYQIIHGVNISPIVGCIIHRYVLAHAYFSNPKTSSLQCGNISPGTGVDCWSTEYFAICHPLQCIVQIYISIVNMLITRQQSNIKHFITSAIVYIHHCYQDVWIIRTVLHQGPLLLTRFNFNPSMDK